MGGFVAPVSSYFAVERHMGFAAPMLIGTLAGSRCRGRLVNSLAGLVLDALAGQFSVAPVKLDQHGVAAKPSRYESNGTDAPERIEHRVSRWTSCQNTAFDQRLGEHG